MSISVQDGVPLDDTTFSYSVEQSCPRLVVILNGYASIGVSATCTQNAHGFNDTAEVVIPLDRDYSVELADAATATSAKAPNPNVTIEVWAGLADTPQYGSTSLSGLRRIFLGLVDDYAAAGVLATITLHCRGAAANLADLKLTKIALGQTSVSFGAEEAAAAGLKFEQNLTLSPITIQQVLGKEFVGGPSLQTSIYRKSAADLLKESATFDDADVWVEDGTVHYERAALVKRGNPIAIHHGHDTVMGDEGLSLSHALRFSKNVRVDVRGFQPRVRISTRATLRFDPTTGAVTKETVSTGMSRSTPIFGTDQTQSLNIGLQRGRALARAEMTELTTDLTCAHPLQRGRALARAEMSDDAGPEARLERFNGAAHLRARR